MTTPCDPTQAPAADSVQKIQEELAGITLDPPSNGAVSHKCETANEPMPTNVNYTDGASILGILHSCSLRGNFNCVRMSDVLILEFLFSQRIL